MARKAGIQRRSWKKWATENKMFPIAYGKFQKKYKDLFAYQKAGNIMLEKLFFARYLEAMSRSEKIGC